jgi:hypothetical protein
VRRKVQPRRVSAAASTRPSAPDAPVNKTGFFFEPLGTDLSHLLDAGGRRTVDAAGRDRVSYIGGLCGRKHSVDTGLALS